MMKIKVRAFSECDRLWRPRSRGNSLSPREERAGREQERGASTGAPPLPGPLLHPMEEREIAESCPALPIARASWRRRLGGNGTTCGGLILGRPVTLGGGRCHGK